MDSKLQRPQRQHSAVCIEVRERKEVVNDTQKPLLEGPLVHKGVLLGSVELIIEVKMLRTHLDIFLLICNYYNQMDAKSLRCSEMRRYGSISTFEASYL